jgi:hypothetical protein
MPHEAMLQASNRPFSAMRNLLRQIFVDSFISGCDFFCVIFGSQMYDLETVGSWIETDSCTSENR